MKPIRWHPWTHIVSGAIAFQLERAASAMRLMEAQQRRESAARIQGIPDVTGTWYWTQRSVVGWSRRRKVLLPTVGRGIAHVKFQSVKLTATIKQSGDKLTGTLEGLIWPDAKGKEMADNVSGLVSSDGSISFDVNGDARNANVAWMYRGKTDGETIQGRIELSVPSGAPGFGVAALQHWAAVRIKPQVSISSFVTSKTSRRPHPSRLLPKPAFGIPVLKKPFGRGSQG